MVYALLYQLICHGARIPRALINTLRFPGLQLDHVLPRRDLLEAGKESSESLNAVYICIDALDEFPLGELPMLLDTIKAVQAWNLPSIHMLTTSQLHNLTIRSTLEALADAGSCVDIQDNTEDDMLTYIRSHLSDPQFSERWSGDKAFVLSDIEKTLYRKSDGS